MLLLEFADKITQPALDRGVSGGKIKSRRHVIGDDVEALLNATLGVLKAEIKNLSFRHGKLPKGFSASDVDAQIQHEPRFADLGRSAENAQSLGDQALDTKPRWRKSFVDQCFTVYDGKILLCVHLFFPFF